MPVSTQNTDILTGSLGRPIVLAYGRHLVGGNVILLDQSDPANTIAFIALGEGEWDGVEDLWINGLQLDLTIPENYQFHKGLKGQLSANGTLDPEGSGSLFPFDQDGDQKVDSLTPPGVQGLTFSRTSYLALKIPFDVFAPSADLSFQGIFRTRKVRIFNTQGVQTSFVYSENPAWQIADLLTKVRGLSDARIDWASFVAAADFADQLIAGGDAGATKRFVSNIAFTQDVDFDQALDAMLSVCRGFLLDTEGTIKLRIDQPRAPIFDFSMDNMVEGSFSAQWQDTKALANRLELNFRDPDNGFAIMTKLWNHEPQQARAGRVNVARLELGNLPQHQAERIGNYLLTRAIDNNLYCKFRAPQAALAVMPGDVVRVKHDAAPWGTAPGNSLFETFEIIEATDNPDETRDFTLQIYRDSTYPDTAGPAQNLQGFAGRSQGPPPTPPNWNLSANLGGELSLSFAVQKGADYRIGDLTLLADNEPNRVTTTLAVALAADDLEMAVSNASLFLVGDYINVGNEILKITGPGVDGAAPTENTWQISRAQKLTQVVSAEIDAVVYRLIEVPLHFVLPPGFTLAHPTLNLADSKQYQERIFRPGRLRILYASLQFSGSIGASVPVERLLALPAGTFEPNVYGTLLGLRTSNGGLGTLQIPGPLATGDDLVMPLILPDGVSIGLVWATVAASPTVQPILLQLLLDDVPIGPLAEIPIGDGVLPSGSGVFFSGAALGNVGGKQISVNITQVGSSLPGEDLTVKVTI